MWFLKQYPPKQLVWDEGNKYEQNGFKGILTVGGDPFPF